MSLFNRNLIFLTLISLAWAWQVMLGLSFILAHVPLSSSLGPQVFPEWQYLLKPEWKTVIYHLVLMSAVLFQGILLWVNRRDLNSRDLFKKWQNYMIVELLLTFLWTSAAFKMIVYADRPVLATEAFIFLFITACLCKVFSSELQQWLVFLRKPWGSLEINPYWLLIAEWCMPLVLFILIFVPNIEGVVARMFIGEQFHHMDGSMMAPAWGYLSGQTLDVDIISEYGIGIIVILSRLTQLFGGFSYEHLMEITILATIFYYIGWYLLIRRWLGSIVLAAAVMLLAVKWQMFHPGVYPFVFTYTSATPIRFFYDVLYFWCLWMHLNTGNKKWLVGAGAACGFGIYYMTTEGVYGTASFVAYILLVSAFPYWRHYFRMRWRDGFLMLLPPVLAMFLFVLTVGPHWPQFQSNIGEFVNYFLSGFGLEYMYKSLADRNFLASLMGFVIPMVYLLTLLIFLSRLSVLKARESSEWMVVVLCLYGLSTYHYYVDRSAVTSYYAVCLPFVFILGFWAKIGLGVLREDWQRQGRWILLGISAWALLTTQLFIAYPNMINLSSHPLTDPKVALPLPAGGPYFNHLFRNFNPALKLSLNSLGGTDEGILSESDFKDDAALVDYYRKQSRFTQDADLIASLTAHSDEVPLISGFETEMLMQANRKTFFYYFPLIISRPMNMRSFEVCSIYTTDQLAKTIDKFEREKPPYVFMERIYMVKEVPKAFLFEYPSLIPLSNYVRTHYTPVAQGEYLVALKRMAS